MTLLVFTEHRFLRTPDGAVWTGSAFAYPFWLRYLETFSSVRVAARVLDASACPGAYRRADGPSVTFHPIPHFVGPLEFLRNCRAVRASCLAALSGAEAILLRVPSTLAGCVTGRLLAGSRPFGVEVVGDPLDVFSSGSIRHPLRPLLRLWAPAMLRRQCRHACVACYVTERALQRRYKVSPHAFESSCSDVELPPEAFVAAPRRFIRASGPAQVITIGALDHLYKGQDLLIRAAASLLRSGFDLHLHFVGDGRLRPLLESMAASIRRHVTFHGSVPSGEPVRRLLDSAGLFALPSRQEGLPRAMVEAMARALPCIGSNVGGIPELLRGDDLFPPNDANLLALRLRSLLSDPDRLSAMSERNWLRAADYREALLRPRRNEYLLELRERTNHHLLAAPLRARHPEPESAFVR
jgi:glycosyltransferase involved in cell wall biosynthesis